MQMFEIYFTKIIVMIKAEAYCIVIFAVRLSLENEL